MFWKKKFVFICWSCLTLNKCIYIKTKQNKNNKKHFSCQLLGLWLKRCCMGPGGKSSTGTVQSCFSVSQKSYAGWKHCTLIHHWHLKPGDCSQLWNLSREKHFLVRKLMQLLLIIGVKLRPYSKDHSHATWISNRKVTCLLLTMRLK